MHLDTIRPISYGYGHLQLRRHKSRAARIRVANVATATAVDLFDAQRGQCRWPLWDNACEHRFVCGAATAAGRSYCAAHQARAVEAAEPVSRSIRPWRGAGRSRPNERG